MDPEPTSGSRGRIWGIGARTTRIMAGDGPGRRSTPAGAANETLAKGQQAIARARARSGKSVARSGQET